MWDYIGIINYIVKINHALKRKSLYTSKIQEHANLLYILSVNWILPNLNESMNQAKTQGYGNKHNPQTSIISKKKQSLFS